MEVESKEAAKNVVIRKGNGSTTVKDTERKGSFSLPKDAVPGTQGRDGMCSESQVNHQ